jgi:lysozyme family protein
MSLTEQQIAATIDAIIKREGGYVNDPTDRGGETNFGITEPFLVQYGAGSGAGTLKNMTRDMAERVYRNMLDATKLTSIPDADTFALVADCAVNHGAGRAIQWLQTALGVTADGYIGSKTIAEMATEDDISWHSVYKSIFRQRGMFYAAIIHNDPSQSKFAVGWFTRLFGFLK